MFSSLLHFIIIFVIFCIKFVYIYIYWINLQFSMSSSNEPEKKRSRSDDSDHIEEEEESMKELPKGWEKRMSRSNSLFNCLTLLLRLHFWLLYYLKVEKSRMCLTLEFLLFVIDSLVKSFQTGFTILMYTLVAVSGRDPQNQLIQLKQV